jgi:PAS domain S-box-containing protein
MDSEPSNTRSAAARRVALIYVAVAGTWILASDIVLAAVSGDFGATAWASLAKGVLFVAVTGLLLYWLVVRTLADARVEVAPPVPPQEAASRWWRSPAVLVLVLGIGLISGLVALQWQHSRISLASEHDTVAAIGELKARQLEGWLTTQADIASSYRSARSLREDIARLRQRHDARVLESLRARLDSIREPLGAQSIAIVDARGAVLAHSGAAVRVSPWLRRQIEASLLTGVPHRTHLHRDPAADGGATHLDYVVPLRQDSALLLRHDPAEFLAPYVESWPEKSRTAESLLVRRDGEDLLFLTDLKGRPDSALALRMPLWSSETPAAQVVRDGARRVRGTDYRGIDVLAYGRPLAGTDWYLVAKIDVAEVLADVRKTTVAAAALILGLTLLAGIGAAALWRQQVGLAELRRRALQAERDALDGHLKMLSQHANDIILLLDAKGRILNANERAFEAYGRKEGGLIGLPAQELRAPDTTDGFFRGFERVLAEGSAIYETVHMRKGGRQFPVEVSARRIDVNGGHFVQAIIRDISERKQAEEELRDSEQRFRAVLEQSIAGIYVIQDGRIAYVNPRMREIFGYRPEDQVDPDPLAFVAPPDRPKVIEQMTHRLSDVPTAAYSVAALRKDGSPFTLGVNARQATYRGRPAIIAVAQDITEKAKAEQEIKRYVARLELAMRSTIEVVSTIGELRDPYTHGHEHRVGEIAAAIAAEMGLGTDQVEGVRVAGYMHDVGKIAVPAEILAKPARLTPAEFELVKGHVQQSYEILKGVEFPWPVAEAAWQHHERLDGSGYPRGLKGEAIILEARILAVADTVEAMASHRPYRPGLGIEKALAEIESKRGALFDERAVDACLRLFREKGYKLPA